MTFYGLTDSTHPVVAAASVYLHEMVARSASEISHIYQHTTNRTPPFVLIGFLSHFGCDVALANCVMEMSKAVLTYSNVPFEDDILDLSWNDSNFDGIELFTLVLCRLIKSAEKQRENPFIKHYANIALGEVSIFLV